MTGATLDLRSSHDATDALIAELQSWRTQGWDVGLVVIDTLNRAMAGGDENSSQDMGNFIANCDRVAKVLGCLVLIVHHSGKNEAAGSRGHSSLLGAVDTEIEVAPSKAAKVGKLTITKSRDGQDGDEVTSCVVVEAQAPTGAGLGGRPLSGAAATATDVLRRVLGDSGETGFVEDNPHVPSVPLDLWKDECYRRADFSNGDEKGKYQAFRRARMALDGLGPISDKDRRVWEILRETD